MMNNMSVPRVCGGDPTTKAILKQHQIVFPVYAGVIPTQIFRLNRHFSVPRVCGGDPDTVPVQHFMERCSPCMRG